MDAQGSSSWSVVELRRYALHPGTREKLIELFEREFVEPQEEVGMHVLGQFRDLDDPDSFVWLRGFPDMAGRARGLNAFYGGPVWAGHRDEANATMIGSDNVLLLRPVEVASGLLLDKSARPPAGSEASATGLVAITICSLAATGAEAFAGFFRAQLKPALREAGAEVVASFATEHSPNNYPALPVREGEEVFVWLSRFPSEAAHADHLARLDLQSLLGSRVEAPPETARLTPTSRSLLRS